MKVNLKRVPKGLLVLALSMVMVMNSAVSCSGWVQKAIELLPVLTQISLNVANIIGAAQGRGQIDPALASQITGVSAEVRSGLATVQALIDSYKAASSASQRSDLLGKIDSALVAIQGNLQQILALAHVQNTALQATITTIIGLALTTVLSIQTLVPPPQGATAARSRMAAHPVRPMRADELKSAFNSVVSSNGYGEFAIQ